MKIHIVKDDGETILFRDVKIVHIDEYMSCAERSDNVQMWSDPIQHGKAHQRTEMVFKK